MIYTLTLRNIWTSSCYLCFIFLILNTWGAECASSRGPCVMGPCLKERHKVSPNALFATRVSGDKLEKTKIPGKKLELFYEIEPVRTENEESFSYILQKIYDSLNIRMDDLHERLTKVEENTQDIKDRLTKVDCYDVKVADPLATSGVYEFFLDHQGKRPVKVWCDMITEGGGWTVIQKRRGRQNENDTENMTNFHKRNLREYTIGFGNPEADYWLGLESIHLLTNARNYELQVTLQDFKNFTAYANYKRFYIEDGRAGYRIHVTGYSGDAGDSMSGSDNFTADNMMFSTVDRDRDTSNEISCAKYWDIGGWWYNRCSWANLNGPYKFPVEDEDCVGINWHKWRNKKCLKATKIMIRPIKIR